MKVCVCGEQQGQQDSSPERIGALQNLAGEIASQIVVSLIMLLCRRGLLLRVSKQRGLCTAAAAGEPLLKGGWGYFGKSSSEIAELEATVREDGEREAQKTLQVASYGLKFQAMLTRPIQWFSDPEWREGWMNAAAEPLGRFSRINDRLLDGCEAAYSNLAAEFNAEKPDLQQFVESGAIEPALASLLEDSLAKYAAAGRRPFLEPGRVNGQVLLIDTSNEESNMVATVVFRTRELRSSVATSVATSGVAPADGLEVEADVPSGAAASDAADGDAIGSATTAGAAGSAVETPESAAAAEAEGEGIGGGSSSDGGAGADAGAGTGAAVGADAVASADAAASTDAAGTSAASGGGGEFEDSLQLWTFTAEHPPMTAYINWLRSTIQQGELTGENSGEHLDEYDTGVRWKLRDINFVVRDYVPPSGPSDPTEAVNEMAMRAGLTLLLSLTLLYTTYKLVTKPRPQRDSSNSIQAGRRSGPPPLGPDRGGSGPAVRPQMGTFPGARPTGAVGTGSNQWGDPVAQTTSQEESSS